jgi:hypothetical protein
MADTPKAPYPVDKDALGKKLVDTVAGFAHSHGVPARKKAPQWAHDLLDWLWSLFG